MSNAAIDPSSLRWIRARALVLTVALSHGCATVVVPAHIQLATLKPGPTAVELKDTRSPAERVYREVGTTSPTKFFADDTLEPSPHLLLASRLAETLPERYLAEPVELTQLNIGYSVVAKGINPSSQPYVPPNIPAAAVAIGLLLAYGIIATLQRAGASESAFAAITVRVGDKEISTIQSVTIDRNRSAQAAVEEALGEALKDIGIKAQALDEPKAEDAAT